jgi:hypothetical protein
VILLSRIASGEERQRSPDTRMSCAVFHTEPGHQMRTMTGKSNHADRSSAYFHPSTGCRLRARPVEISLGIRLSKCDLSYRALRSKRLIGDLWTHFQIGCERIFRFVTRRKACIPNHPRDEVNACYEGVYGESAGARTQDQRLKRAMLYQLSYALLPPINGSTSSV